MQNMKPVPQKLTEIVTMMNQEENDPPWITNFEKLKLILLTSWKLPFRTCEFPRDPNYE